jgi:hypothetical protein
MFLLPTLRLYFWIFAAGLMTCALVTHQLSADENSSDLPWYRTSIVGMEIGPTGAQFGYSAPDDQRYCAKWDGAEIVRRCVEAEAEYLVLWLRDGDYAYYDSKLLPKAPGLGDRDPLRDAFEEATKHRLPIISYTVVQQAGHFLEKHPQWQMRDSDGNPLGRFCFNSGYLEAMKQIVAEQLAYGIAGFHIDMLDQGFGKPYGCWCDACRTQFRDRYQHEMPRGGTWDKDWDEMLEFRYDTSQRFERELTAHIKSLNPNSTVDYNYHGNPPFSFEVGQRPVQHAGNGDFVTGETGVWGFSALGVGLNAEFYRAATPGLPFQVAMQRGVRMYHDQTTRPLHDMRWELFTLLSHGAFVTMIDKTAFDGGLDAVAYERMGQALREARTKQEHFGQRPVYDIGLYFSSRTRDWYGCENAAKYFQSFQGAHQACVMEHLQYGVVLDENVTLQTLQKFPVICLPNVAIVSGREAELFRSYVRDGGKLIITGETAQYDSYGNPLEASGLEDLVGATVAERLVSEDNWVNFARSSVPTAAAACAADLREDWPFLVKGPATVYRPVTATAVGQLHKPDRTQRQLEGTMGTEWPMSAAEAAGPAVLVHSYGKGVVVTCAASPDYATASEHALVEDRILFRNLLRQLQVPRRVGVEAPAQVEVVVTDDPAARVLRVHVLAYHATPRTTPAQNRPYVLPGLIEDRPLFRVRLTAQEMRSAEALSPATKLTQRGPQLEALVEDVHEVLLLRY